MEKLQCMLDLETWSSEPNAVVISIGAVKFVAESRQIVDKFHVGIDPTYTSTKSFDISPSTMMWWLDPERHDARASWLALQKVDLGTALVGFAEWLGDDMPMWGNGAGFDNVVLRTAYKLLGIECPWGFRSDRCFRTLKNLAPNVSGPVSGAGVAHDALFDAEWQARHLMEIFAYLDDVAAG